MLTPAIFVGESDKEREFMWTITTVGEEAELQLPCQPEQTILEGLAPLHKIKVIKGCRNGGCGICKIRIHSGDVERGLMSRAHVSDEEIATGYVLSCRAWPRSDLIVEIVSRPRAPRSRTLP